MISGLLFGLLNAKAQAPVADFSATPTSGCGPLGVRFTDLSSNKPIFWSWDFGNGNVSNVQNPTTTYGAPGTYNVKLIVRNTSGSDVVEKDGYITVYPGPTPQFTSNLTLACAPASIQFIDKSNPGQGSITSWAWNFGDGSTSSQQNPAHTYSQTGYYNISLSVTNSGGCSNPITQNRYIRVVNGIQPNFTFNQQSTTCSAPFTGQLLNQSAGPGNLTFNWAVNNGATPSNSADTSPIVTFPNNGQYNVNLQVTSSLGCTATLQQVLPFTNNPAIVIGPTNICVNTPVIFADGSSPPPPATP
ncbi:MAG TPA: PKD domain-containing protein, partial [Puia sp.]|nr:PKD domain-containing protein [Puia sp.]